MFSEVDTIWVGLHGRFEPHAPALRGAADAYELLVERSAAMGWLTDAVRPEPSGLWGMNDAVLDERLDPASGLFGWFQVIGADPWSASRPVPLQPLLACIEAVVQRAGRMQIDAVRILLPGRSSVDGETVRRQLASAAGWFAGCAESAATSVRVTFDGADGLAQVGTDVLQGCRQVFVSEVLRANRIEPAGDAVPEAVANFVGPRLGGTGTLAMSAQLVEWSLDAIAWTGALLSELLGAAGVVAPVMLTVRRT